METNNNVAPSATPAPEPTVPEAPTPSDTPTKSSEPALQPDPTPAKSPKPLTWCLAFLAVIGIVAAAIFAYLYFTTPTPSTPNNSQGSNLPETEKDTPSSADEEIAISVTLEEAKTLLSDKYKFLSVERPMYDGWYKYMENFDQATKILFTIHQTEDKFESEASSTSPSIRGEISFDDFNSEYIYYFGSEEPLEKKTYQLDSNNYIREITYVPENDRFVVNFPDGIGGTTPVRRIHKVISVSDTKDGFKAIIASTTINYETDPYGHEDEIAEGLSVYEFYFTKENDDYVLSSIKKL